MRNALQDQLLKAGLVTERQVKQANAEQRKDARAPKDDARQRAQRAAAEKAERDRQLNLQREAEQARKANVAQIQQLIEAHRVEAGEGEFAFNFSHGVRVKRLYVSDAVRERLVRGSLAIVKASKGYALVPADVADKIAERDAASVILHNRPSQTPTAAQDDPYAAYAVPDDLMW